MKRIHFYYNEYTHAWYADVKEHTAAQNIMVAGADKFLEKLSGDSLDVIVTVSDNLCGGCRLKRFAHNPGGAFYKVHAPDYDAVDGSTLWLCNVTHTVLGKHPKWINVIDVRPVERKDVADYIPIDQMSEDFKMLFDIDKSYTK